jgi:hypothetical protein
MKEGVFRAQLNQLNSVFKKLGILDYRNFRPSYPNNPASLFRKKAYLDVWNDCFVGQFYDFQLADNSLFQFQVYRYKPLKFSYGYYECPYDCLTYYEFLLQSDYELLEVGDSFRPEYEEYLTTCSLKLSFTPIRYDYDPGSHVPGRHPAAHVHIGFSNNIRIGARNILKPISFVLFVLRQCYPDRWLSFVNDKQNLTLCSNIRETLNTIDSDNWTALDSIEMVLH